MTKITKTKVDAVIALCGRKSGCTLSNIMDKLSVTRAAAASLIGDARRKGIKLKYEKRAAGRNRYYV